MSLPAHAIPVFCPCCRRVTAHMAATCTVTCPGCGHARAVDVPLLMLALHAPERWPS